MFRRMPCSNVRIKIKQAFSVQRIICTAVNGLDSWLRQTIIDTV